ncbi:MAG: methyltransferase domain-containing protein [Pseudomonadota bacterium]|nr:methyltransferase domain-containing protein [Pseudomonadota bacterium]
MSQKLKQHTSQSVGLDIAVNLANFATGKDNLHYGIWDGLDVNLGNLCLAQEAYTKKLLSYLPKGKKLTILDVGGGAGETAKELLSLGHEVTLIVPSASLASLAKKNTRNEAKIKLCTFEDYEPNRNQLFDLCLFSESFQYIPLRFALKKAKKILKNNGKVLISDCFRSNAIKQKYSHRPPGGGHLLSEMYEEIKLNNLRVISSEEITQSVSGSIDLEQKFYNTIGSILIRVKHTFSVKNPILFLIASNIYKFLLSKKKRINVNNRLYKDLRNSKIFEKYNHYMVFFLEPIN